MKQVNTNIVEAVKEAVDFASENAFDLGEEFYYNNAPEGVTPESVEAQRNYNLVFSESVAQAFGDLTTSAIENGTTHRAMSIGASMGKGMSFAVSARKSDTNEEEPWGVRSYVTTEGLDGIDAINLATMNCLNKL